MEKNMHIKGMVSKGLRALSHTKKSTKIINLKCTFVISYNLLMFNYMAYFCFFFSQKLLHIQVLPLPLWNSPSELAEWLYPRPESSVKYAD